MTETSSIVQAVDDYIGEHLNVPLALQNLFKSQPTNELQPPTTPSRTLQALNRQVFCQLLAAIVAYGMSLSYADQLQAWSEPIYDQLRAELTAGELTSELHYHEVIPLLRMYKAYVTLAEGLQINPHPLEIALLNPNLSFSPALQEELRKSILDAFTSACKFRQLHREVIDRDPASWEALAQAEIKAARTLIPEPDEIEQRLGSGDASAMGESMIGVEQLSLEELQSQGLQLQAEKEELNRSLKQHKTEDGKLEAELKRLDDKLKPLTDRIKDIQKQIELKRDDIERSANTSIVTTSDVERKKEELQMLQKRESDFYAEMAALDEKISSIRNDILTATEVLHEGLHPLKDYIINEVVPATSSFSTTSNDAARLSAEKSVEDVDYQTKSSHQNRELGQINQEIENTKARINDAEDELERLRASTQELLSEEHKKENSMKLAKLQKLTYEATTIMRQQRESESKFQQQKAEAKAILNDCDEFLKLILGEQKTYAQRNATALSSVIKDVIDQLTELT